MTAPVACSVLIPVYNEERHIAHTVAAMQSQRCDHGSVEFLFADGRSTDRTRELLEAMAREDGRIRVLDNPARTVSSGLNVALRHARGKWVVRMDAHTVYADDYIEAGVERLQRGGTRWVSGPPVPRGHNCFSRAVALALSTSYGRGGSRKWGRLDERDRPEFELDSGVFGGVWERATLLSYGGWDERWPRNSDSEMAARFLERGERLICLPRMAAEYTPRDTPHSLWRQYTDYGRYRIRTARRHPASLRRSHVLPIGLVINDALALLGPRPLRQPARAAATVHLGALLVAGVRSLPEAERRVDSACVPVALAAMHFGFGVGAIRDIASHGVPWAALSRIVGIRRPAPSRERAAEPTYAPSLSA